MQIYIMRHGQAEGFTKEDAQRTLTEHGVAEVAAMANWFSQHKPDIAQIFVSPFKRAQQTAQTFCHNANLSANPETLAFITPSGSAIDVHDYIDGVIASEKPSSMLFVSHMPLVSYLVSELTANEHAPIFQTGAIAHIDYDIKKMKGELVSITSPVDVIEMTQ